MDHGEIKNNILAFYDGELFEKERQEVLAHLESCIECRAVLQRWGTTSSVFFRTPPSRVSEDFVHSVMERLEHLESTPSGATKVSWSLLNRWFFPAFVGAALAGFIAVMMVPLEEPRLLMDTILLPNKTENIPSDWLTSSEILKADQILSYVLGEL
jgi:anti-sigma factor RsiW